MPAYQNKGVPQCPTCDEPMERMRRAILMRVLVGSKRYYCRHCFRGHLYFLGYRLPF